MSRANDISSDYFSTKGRGQRKAWPEGCIWPEPVWDSIWGGNYWEVEDVELVKTDEDIEDLLEIREYMDSLVDEGRLNEDYSLNEDYIEEEFSDDEETEQSIGDEEEPFSPEKGIDYWDDGFDVESWENELIEHINLIKIPASTPDPVSIIRDTIGYEFVNENLMRQAFTRRAFGTVYGVGNSEELEFLGDSVLNMIVTREMARQFSEVVTIHPHAPFQSRYSEGEMTKIRSHFVNKEHLAWDWHVLEEVADRLVCIQITKPDEFLKKSYYDLFNAWHQRHFGCIPDYEIYCHMGSKSSIPYHCTIRFSIPENQKGLMESQRIDIDEETRGSARERAAWQAYSFVMNAGLWINLSDAGVVPSLENSINQLQELYQKKYLEDKPEYTFEERKGDVWRCDCVCGGVNGFGEAGSKTAAKKKASYMVLVRMLSAAGICKKEWKEQMYKNVLQ